MRWSIHPLFLVVGGLAILFAATDFFLALLIAVILHEMAHALMARCFGVKAQRLTLTPFGGAVQLSARFLAASQRSLILLAGPVASLLLSLFFGVIVWLFPVAFGYLEYLVAANFLIGIMNIIPIYPLDGGKLLANHVAPRLILLWSNLFFVGLLLLSLIFFNFAFIFFAIVTLIQINWEYRASVYQDKFCAPVRPKAGKLVRRAVCSTTTLFTAYRLMNSKHPTEFVVTDSNGRIFYEKELEQWLLTFPLDTPLRQCF